MTIYNIDNPLSDDGRNKLNQNFEEQRKKIDEQKDRVDKLIINNPQPSEIIDARGKFRLLRDRLEAMGTDIDSKATRAELENKLSKVANGSPRGVFPTVADLISTFPIGDNHIYVVTENGNWYYWDGSAWMSGGIYQSTQLNSNQLYDMMRLPNPQPTMMMKNEIINGDFSEGNTKWIGGGSVWKHEVIDGVMHVTALTDSVYPQISQSTQIPYSEGRKVYIKAKARVTNSDSIAIKYFLYTAGTNTRIVTAVENPIENQYYEKGLVLEAPKGGATSNRLSIYIAHYYPDSATGNGKTMHLDNVIALDLTSIFGAGNEPTAEEMDAILKSFSPSSGWFDGVQEVPMVGTASGKVFTEIDGRMELVEVGKLVNIKDIPIDDQDGIFETDNLDYVIKSIKRTIDDKLGIPFDNSFTPSFVFDSSKDLIPVDPRWEYTTSTFSGWGGAIGNPKDFNSVVFKIRNRSSNAIPIDKIRVSVTELDHLGTVLADRTISGFDIGVGEEREICFPLGATITNEGERQLWALFQCDQTIDVWYGFNKHGHNLNLPSYGPTAYQTAGKLNAPREASAIADSDLFNTGKPYLFVAHAKQSLVPTQSFKDSLSDIDVTTSAEPVRVILPNKYDVVVGDTFQLFYRGIIEAVDPYIYDIQVVYRGANGKAYPRYFELTPQAADVGTRTLTITVLTHSGVKVGEATTNIVVSAVGASPTRPVNVLCIGDSLTSGGHWVQEANRRLSQTGGAPVGNGLNNINFIGTKSGQYNTKWEGYGGWTWNSYLDAPTMTSSDMWVYVVSHNKTAGDQHSLWVDADDNKWKLETIEATRLKFTRHLGHSAPMPTGAGTLTHNQNAVNTSSIAYNGTSVADGNPFWNAKTSAVDFVDYCARNGFSGIDYVYTLLTWNGQQPYRATPEDNIALINSAKKLIDIIHVQFPNAKIKIMGIQLPSLNGGMGTNYGSSGGYSHLYGNIRTVFGINLAYQKLANDPEYTQFVEFINVSGQFDSENMMPETTKLVNTRSTVVESFGTNGVHPTLDGYLMIGDATYRNMVSTILV